MHKNPIPFGLAQFVCSHSNWEWLCDCVETTGNALTDGCLPLRVSDKLVATYHISIHPSIYNCCFNGVSRDVAAYLTCSNWIHTSIRPPFQLYDYFFPCLFPINNLSVDIISEHLLLKNLGSCCAERSSFSFCAALAFLLSSFFACHRIKSATDLFFLLAAVDIVGFANDASIYSKKQTSIEWEHSNGCNPDVVKIHDMKGKTRKRTRGKTRSFATWTACCFCCSSTHAFLLFIVICDRSCKSNPPNIEFQVC